MIKRLITMLCLSFAAFAFDFAKDGSTPSADWAMKQ